MTGTLKARPYILLGVLALVLGALPLLLLTQGFAGGLLLAPAYPLLAGYIGWRIHRLDAGRCWRQVLWVSGLSACVFVGLFLEFYAAALSQRAAVMVGGGAAVFLGAFLAAAFFTSLGVAARHARTGAPSGG
jgi:hypothetical protein